MRNSKIFKMEAVVAVIFLSAMLLLPSFSATIEKTNSETQRLIRTPIPYEDEDIPAIRYDTIYIPKEDVAFAGEQNDIGYNVDGGNNIVKSLPVYVGEPVEENTPGRGRTGTLDPSSNDNADWYSYSVCEGQSISVSLSSSEDYDYEIGNALGESVGHSYTADITGLYFINIFANDGAGEDDYTFNINLGGQNDAGTGNDAGDSIASATSLSEGDYSGYMDVNDQEDWYSFSANTGEGIFVTVEPLEKSDYDIHLYNPSNELVHSAQYYGEDELEYPADASGTWKIKIDMFPGWDTSKWPDDYFMYGSGAYELSLSIGGSAQSPPGPIPQPDITPVAQTFIINDDPNSNKDEYGYIAAVPAANYIEDGERYVSPIIYQDCNQGTNWFGTVDDSTQYLIDDWNTYLARHGSNADEYIVDNNPVIAAANIAMDKWEYSSTAVVTIDGSNFVDEIDTVIDEDSSLSSSPETSSYSPGDFKEFSGYSAVPMFLGKKWGAIHLIARGDSFSGDTSIINPRYENVKQDDWPHPYDLNGPDYDTFYPITQPGIWIPYLTSESGLEELQIIKYPGARYTIPVDTTDCSIKVKIETNEPSNLIVYLVDPKGNVRRPQIPHWNGGEIRPIHYWNGGHWEHNFDDYRYWIVEPHDDFTVELHHPMTGKWTAIVVPYFNHPSLVGGFNGGYHITATIRKHNPDRIDSAMSAANAAVIASMNHAPLLYVSENSVPSETSNVLSQLGVSNIIFVNLNEVSSATLSGSITEYSTMTQVVDAIKNNPKSENFITITSLGTGEGYFATAAMISAYHISPVLNIGEKPDPYNTLDQIASWREHTSDAYHGCSAPGHLPLMEAPIDLTNPPSILDLIIYYLKNEKTLPPLGLDLKLQWFSLVYDGIHELISDYGLDKSGKEAYMFVSPREYDIRHLVCRAMTGNNSYAGMIPVETTAFSTAVICRNILYPALIFANEGRNIISSVFMNYRDGHSWTCNDGVRDEDYITQKVKEFGFSHGRSYEGHTTWENILERYNNGAGLMYHCSHGTGGSGICCMYKNVEEQFPYNEINHEHLRDFDWWDAWRGYYYDNRQTKTPRDGGLVWFNAEEPNLYDIIHFKYCDQLFENLHSQFVIWQSCSTGEQFGPSIYLEHGATIVTANAGSGRSPQSEIQDTYTFEDMLVRGLGIGESMANKLWLFDRDFTTCDPVTLYGPSSTDGGDGLTNARVLYGDPTLTCYSPEWIEPIPLEVQ